MYVKSCVPQSCVFIVRVIHYGSSCGQFHTCHGGHCTSKHSIYRNIAWMQESDTGVTWSEAFDFVQLNSKSFSLGLVLSLIHSRSSSWGTLLNSPMMSHWLCRLVIPWTAMMDNIPTTVSWSLNFSPNQPNSCRWNQNISHTTFSFKSFCSNQLPCIMEILGRVIENE